MADLKWDFVFTSEIFSVQAEADVMLPNFERVKLLNLCQVSYKFILFLQVRRNMQGINIVYNALLVWLVCSSFENLNFILFYYNGFAFLSNVVSIKMTDIHMNYTFFFYQINIVVLPHVVYTA